MHLILLRHCSRVDKAYRECSRPASPSSCDDQVSPSTSWLANFDPPVDLLLADKEMDAAVRMMSSHIAPEHPSKRLRILIHCSPYNRCIQTAEMLLSRLEHQPEFNPAHCKVTHRLRVDQALSEWLNESFNLNFLPPNDDGYSMINNVNIYLTSPTVNFGMDSQIAKWNKQHEKTPGTPPPLNPTTRTHLRSIKDSTWSYNALGHCGDYGEPPLEFKQRCFDYLTTLLQHYYTRQPYSADKDTVLIVISHGAVISTLLQMLLNRPIFNEIPLCTPVYFKQSECRRTVFSLMDYDFNLNKILTFSSDRELYRLLSTPIDMGMIRFEDSSNELATIGTAKYTTIIQSPTRPGRASRPHSRRNSLSATNSRSNSRRNSFSGTNSRSHSRRNSLSRTSSRNSDSSREGSFSRISPQPQSYGNLATSGRGLSRSNSRQNLAALSRSGSRLNLAGLSRGNSTASNLFGLEQRSGLVSKLSDKPQPTIFTLETPFSNRGSGTKIRKRRSNTISMGSSVKTPGTEQLDEYEKDSLRQTHSSRQLHLMDQERNNSRTYDLNKLASYFDDYSDYDSDSSFGSQSSTNSSDYDAEVDTKGLSIASVPRIPSLSSLNSLKNTNSAANSIRGMLVDPTATSARRSSLASAFLQELLGDSPLGEDAVGNIDNDFSPKSTQMARGSDFFSGSQGSVKGRNNSLSTADFDATVGALNEFNGEDIDLRGASPDEPGVLSFGFGAHTKSSCGSQKDGDGIIEGTFTKMKFNSKDEDKSTPENGSISTSLGTENNSEIKLISTLSKVRSNSKNSLKHILFSEDSGSGDESEYNVEEEDSWFGFN